MKKLLLIPLAIVILITFMAPSVGVFQIVIRGEEGLAELRRIVEADEEELKEYIRHIRLYTSDRITRECLINLLGFFDSLPLPSTSEIRFSGLSYFPDWNEISVGFLTDIGESYRFINLGRREIAKGELLFKLDMNFENLVNIYSTTSSQDFKLNWRGDISFIVDIDDFVFNVTYNHGDNWHIRTVNPEEMFKFLYGVEPWVYVPEPFTTEEALIILQAAAGLTTLSDDDIARFEIDSTPTTADALRILRIVAGLA
ncbi:MAG: hypothetical protein LBC86_01715 [Oscillospiraceae bacterium]|nr:hypothetical protein [Oscillospiraceae bacterium]